MKLIPNALLRAHEDGKVVFFCGAGVSKSAGLPTFRELTCLVLTSLLPPPDKYTAGDPAALAWAAYKGEKFDDAFGLLESPNLGTFDPKEVRRRVRSYLSSPVPEAPDAHKALIRLAGLDRPEGRLVTTNFDRLFETAHASLPTDQGHVPPLDLHVAPALPPPKRSVFQGLLYLHGRLDPDRIEQDKHLVLTTADFGSAYMLDGWALRFVVDLFRHYHVVFVGYSVNDPTMRYLTSAMALVRDEDPTLFRTAYSFAPYSGTHSDTDKDRVALIWRSKGIEPILYDDADKHTQLWDSIREWADYQRRGLAAHRHTVVRLSHIALAGKKDDRIDEMVWALRVPGIAKYFADRTRDDRPDPAWIAALQERGFLSRPEYRPDDPASPASPRAPLASRQLSDAVIPEDTTAHLSRWIAQCLEDRRTLNWALSEGAVLHSASRREIRWVLEDDSRELPIALRKVWSVLASDDYAGALSRMNANGHSSLSLYKGLSAEENFAQIAVLHGLRPVPVFQMRERDSADTDAQYRADPARWYTMDLGLEGIRRKSEIAEIRKAAVDWVGALANMAEALTGLLKEAMNWLGEFGLANARFDLTHIHYRSINPHEQIEFTPIWTELIGLCRDAHDALIASADSAIATRLIDRWRSESYPVFRRLALNAATKPEMDMALGLELLLEGKYPTLWDRGVRRETLRFLRKRGDDIQAEPLGGLLDEILKGPPREMDMDTLSAEEWQRFSGDETRVRLQKLTASGVRLPEATREMYDPLLEDAVTRPRSGGSHPEEFGTFVSFGRGGIPSFEAPVTVGKLREYSVGEFVQWAEEHERKPWILRTAWTGLLQQDRRTAVRHLRDAGEQGCWPLRLWSELLHALRDSGEEGEHRAVVRAVGEKLAQMPVDVLANMSADASRWLKDNREFLETEGRLQLWRRMWQVSASADEVGTEHVADFQLALNHAGGILGEMLYAEMADDIPTVWAGQSPGLPDRLRKEFASIGKGDSLSCRLARVSMAVRLVELYRLDPKWTNDALLSRMGSAPEGCVEDGLWEGYFAGRQCSEDLLAAFKEKLLGVLSDLRRLSPIAQRRAVHHFIHIAIWERRGISQSEAKSVAWGWDETNLAEAAWAIADVLGAAGDSVDVLWKELVGPWFESAWPRREQNKTRAVSEALCRIAMAVNATFPNVVGSIKDFLVPKLEDDTLDRLSQKRLATEFPEATLRLLDKIFGHTEEEGSTEIAQKLVEEAMNADPTLCKRPEFERLSRLVETDPTAGAD